METIEKAICELKNKRLRFVQYICDKYKKDMSSEEKAILFDELIQGLTELEIAYIPEKELIFKNLDKPGEI